MNNWEKSDESKQYSFNLNFKAKVDFQVFRLPEGIVSENLRQTFERLMIDTGLLISPNTGQN